MLEIKGSDFIDILRAKGLGEPQIARPVLGGLRQNRDFEKPRRHPGKDTGRAGARQQIADQRMARDGLTRQRADLDRAPREPRRLGERIGPLAAHVGNGFGIGRLGRAVAHPGVRHILADRVEGKRSRRPGRAVIETAGKLVAVRSKIGAARHQQSRAATQLVEPDLARDAQEGREVSRSALPFREVLKRVAGF